MLLRTEWGKRAQLLIATISRHNDLKRVVIDLVEFSNQWYRNTCKKEGLDPDNVLSDIPISLARECAVGMKKYMDAKPNYPDERIQKRLDNEIGKLNNKRIGHMLDALQFAELVANIGKGFNGFLKKQVRKGDIT